MHFETADPRASWAVLDDDGRLIAGQNSHARQDPASTTKMATLYTICYLMDKGELPHNFLKTHKHDVDRMCIRSDNQAAARLAAAAGGNVDRFCHRMTALMHARGLTESRFISPSGWPQEGHYSTAADMARIAYILDRDYPQYTHLMGRDYVRGIGRNTGRDVIGEYCDFGKTGTGTGVYGSTGRKAFVGGSDEGFFAIAGARGPKGRNDFSRAAARFLGRLKGEDRKDDTERDPSPSRDHDPSPYRYKVERGDTLSEIADRFGLSTAELRADNRLRGATVQAGQALKISGVKEITVDPGDTLLGYARHLASRDGAGGLDTGDALKIICELNPDLKATSELRRGESLIVPSSLNAARRMQRS